MRVDDRNLVHGPASQPGKASESQEVDRGIELKAAGARWAAGVDQIELSGLAGRLSHALTMSSAERAGRVEKLATQYQQGRYDVDPLRLSRAMLAEIRAAGHEDLETGRGADLLLA